MHNISNLQTLNGTADEALANITETMNTSAEGVDDATLSELWHVFVAVVTLGSEVRTVPEIELRLLWTYVDKLNTCNRPSCSSLKGGDGGGRRCPLHTSVHVDPAQEEH